MRRDVDYTLLAVSTLPYEFTCSVFVLCPERVFVCMQQVVCGNTFALHSVYCVV